MSVCLASPLISLLQDKCFILIPLLFLWILSLFVFMFIYYLLFIHSFACLFICLFLFYLFDKFLFFSFLSVCGVSSSFDHYYLIISPTFHPLHWSRQQIPPEGERKRNKQKDKEEERRKRSEKEKGNISEIACPRICDRKRSCVMPHKITIRCRCRGKLAYIRGDGRCFPTHSTQTPVDATQTNIEIAYIHTYIH